MAKLLIMSIQDLQVNSFHRPIFVPTRGFGLRLIRDELHRPESELARHPEDYRVFELGEWDEDSGLFVGHSLPVFVCDCRSLLET